MGNANHDIGFVYVLTNESMPGIVKVGLTTWLPEDRAHSLFTTGVPTPFVVAYRAVTSRPDAVEQRAHKLLGNQRVNQRREFFEVSVEQAIEAVRFASVEVAGIESWKAMKPHCLRSGDRLALSLEKGQFFALISYPSYQNILSASPEIIDLWQAHSEGDLLEIYVTNSATHIAGFSDNDPTGMEDPVPYLNRDKVANGLINGRERLMPGERLVWVPAKGAAKTQASVVFESVNHCQIVSRTWNPQRGPHGFPFLLNDFLYEDTWPAAQNAIREALRLPIPNTWAPRQNRGSEWEVVGSMPKSPEYWLTQLNPKTRKKRKGKRKRKK